MPRSKAKRRADRERRKQERQQRGQHKIFDTKQTGQPNNG